MAGRLSATLLCALLAGGCDDSELGRSCGGEPVLVCPAHEWADVVEASLTPDAIPLGDVAERAQIRVELARCDEAPALHDVAISALVPESDRDPDGGIGRVEVFNLLTVRDGEDGDASPDPAVIDVEVVNPFGTGVPEDRDITLRFEAVSRAPSGCGSGTLEIPYRTGTIRSGP